jgi:DNA-binding transcriptional MerR regulator
MASDPSSASPRSTYIDAQREFIRALAREVHVEETRALVERVEASDARAEALEARLAALEARNAELEKKLSSRWGSNASSAIVAMMGDKKGKVDEALLAEIAALGDAAERHQALIDRMDEEVGQLIEMVCEPTGGKLPPAAVSASPSVGKDGKPVGHATMPDGYRPLDFSDSSSSSGSGYPTAAAAAAAEGTAALATKAAAASSSAAAAAASISGSPTSDERRRPSRLVGRTSLLHGLVLQSSAGASAAQLRDLEHRILAQMRELQSAAAELRASHAEMSQMRELSELRTKLETDFTTKFEFGALTGALSELRTSVLAQQMVGGATDWLGVPLECLSSASRVPLSATECL